MTAPTAPKLCTVEVRRAAMLEKCGTKLVFKKDYGMVCPEKATHLHPIVTGFCNSGWHEGAKIDKPTCKSWINCPCDCHTNLSRMFEMGGQPRVTFIDNSTYTPGDGGFKRVSLTELVQTAVAAQPNTRVVASPAPGLVPNMVEKDFAPTPSGRAGRGQLESWVRAVTDTWALDPDENCTPQYVSEKIAKMEGLAKGPSTGAIDAVFKRWDTIGFAFIRSRPTRFAGYTPDGITLGLEVLKARAKR